MFLTTDQLHVCNDAESLAQYAAVWLPRLIERTLAEPERTAPFVLALSGGSTPKRMFQLLAEQPSGNVDWNKVVLVWGDERNVPPEHADSNFRMVRETLLDSIQIPEENILAVPAPGDSAEKAASAYDALLRERLPAEEGQPMPVIDCVLLGMGDDVHTASLFPGTEALAETKRLVVANHVPKLDTHRITFTAPFINAARNVAFLICGEAKKDALARLWHAEKDFNLYPAQLIRPEKGQLWYLVDKPALGDTPLPETVMVQML
ncbi:MAG: 6-phosphogluconolactonase [Aureliella sp.]